MSSEKLVKVSEPTLRRLPLYLKLLKKMEAEAKEYVSCTDIAREFHSDPIQVRKDLASTGVVGTARLGFKVNDVIECVETFLGWRNKNEAFLIGVGNLGRALLTYKRFNEYGFTIVAAFDSDPALIGNSIAGVEVLPVERLEELMQRMHIPICVLAVPAECAQEVTDRIVASGVKGIWNFSPIVLNVPGTVIVEYVLLSTSLAVLTSKLNSEKKDECRQAG
jgi:redox-sensing transcriptional repressor